MLFQLFKSQNFTFLLKIELNLILFADNSGYSPSVVSIPALTSSTKFKIGSTHIKIGATDLSGNTKKCAFTITVIGKKHSTFILIFFVKIVLTPNISGSHLLDYEKREGDVSLPGQWLLLSNLIQQRGSITTRPNHTYTTQMTRTHVAVVILIVQWWLNDCMLF